MLILAVKNRRRDSVGSQYGIRMQGTHSCWSYQASITVLSLLLSQEDGRTSLMIAAATNQVEILNLLLDIGAMIEKESEVNFSSLSQYRGTLTYVHYLLMSDLLLSLDVRVCCWLRRDGRGSAGCWCTSPR